MTDEQVSELWSDEAIARTLGRRHLDYSLRTALEALKDARAEIEERRELLKESGSVDAANRVDSC